MTELAAAVARGERAAVADALNLVDDARPARQREARALLRALTEQGRAPRPRVGLTGPPGAGKSTLLDALTRQLRARGSRVGIVAVDPSSQRSGGALLGDRIRVRAGARDDGVFFRSMAAREQLGGLAAATRASVDILEAAYDWIFVETVGVGQSESDVVHLVDTLVYVAQPGAGDLLQYMKAGIVELPDAFVVNKTDIGKAATQTASELRSGIALAPRDASGWDPPVLLTSARDDVGIDELVSALEAHREKLAGEPLRSRRLRGRDHFLREELMRRYGSFGLAAYGGRDQLGESLAALSSNGLYDALDRLCTDFERAIGKQPQ